ncbi:MAG: leucine-rich repeat domain-containing protein [Culicoidibacterales bacterium]
MSKQQEDFEIFQGRITKYLGNSQEVTIPDGISYIGEWAFSHKNLTKVTIPASVHEFGEGAFASNNLTEVILPPKTWEISESAFASNPLVKVVLPNGTRVGDWAFDCEVELVREYELELERLKAANAKLLYENELLNQLLVSKLTK